MIIEIIREIINPTPLLPKYPKEKGSSVGGSNVMVAPNTIQEIGEKIKSKQILLILHFLHKQKNEMT